METLFIWTFSIGFGVIFVLSLWVLELKKSYKALDLNYNSALAKIDKISTRDDLKRSIIWHLHSYFKSEDMGISDTTMNFMNKAISTRSDTYWMCLEASLSYDYDRTLEDEDE